MVVKLTTTSSSTSLVAKGLTNPSSIAFSVSHLALLMSSFVVVYSLSIDAYERGDKFYLYTGRGPSTEALHLGHLIPFMFTKYLQDAFRVPLVIQLTDYEKCIWKDLSIEENQKLARENAKYIIACGVDITKTSIFSDFDYVVTFTRIWWNLQSVSHILRLLVFLVSRTRTTLQKSVFHLCRQFHHFHSFLQAKKENLLCLIPCAIDQDPHFRMTQDVAPRIGYNKPTLFESSFFPALQGESGKMFSTFAIYVTDSAKEIKNKINKYAFSGGQDSVEKHRQYGANIEVDISVKYLNFFLDDDSELEHIKKEYGVGLMLTGEVKQRFIQALTEIVERHRKARAAVTDEWWMRLWQ